VATAVAALACGFSAGVRPADAQSDSIAPSDSGELANRPLELTPAQRSAIYQSVSKDRSKTARTGFPAVVGADVPPMLELYTLPDQTLADNPTAKLFRYTMVQDEVVIVDPTKMRVVDVIGPNGG
jgi:hypothetical protein